MKKQTLKALTLAAAIAAISATAQADVGKTKAYMEAVTAESVAKDSFGHCWRTGTWTQDQATVEGCDGYVKAAPAPAPVAEKPAAPAPAPKAAPKKPEVFTLSSDVLFDHNKSTLKAEGNQALDKFYDEYLAAEAKYATVNVKGHADRMGKDAYNQKLSEARAKTVADYLVSKGFKENAITAIGLGETSPVTGNTCDKVKVRAKRIECLAPDRRVEIEVDGTK